GEEVHDPVAQEVAGCDPLFPARLEEFLLRCVRDANLQRIGLLGIVWRFPGHALPFRLAARSADPSPLLTATETAYARPDNRVSAPPVGSQTEASSDVAPVKACAYACNYG